MPTKFKEPTPDPLPTKNFLAVDTETTGFKFRLGARPFAVSACDDTGKTFLWEATSITPATKPGNYPKVKFTPSQIRDITTTLNNYPITVFHNATFDIKALNSIGIAHNLKTVHDTLLASHVYHSEESHKLKDLSCKYLEILDTDQHLLQALIVKSRAIAKRLGIIHSDAVTGDYWLPSYLHSLDPSPLPPETSNVLAEYATTDAVRTALLWSLYASTFNQKKHSHELRCYHREQALIPTTLHLEHVGINVKPTCLKSEHRRIQTFVNTTETSVQLAAKSSTFNIRSGQQVQDLLYHKLAIPVIKRTKTGIATDRETLESLLDIPEIPPRKKKTIQQIIDYRRGNKSLDYIKEYESAGNLDKRNPHTVYPSIAQVGGTQRFDNGQSSGTRTTRYAYNNPNMQNVGVRDSEFSLRGVFGPRTGNTWYCLDFSQLELRILSVAANEKSMLKAFDAGEDIHQLTADLFGIERWRAKNINFAWTYGAGLKKLSAMAGMDAQTYLRTVNKAYPAVVKFMAKATATATRQGFVRTLYGYPLQVTAGKEYTGANYIIQGTAGDILKNSLRRLYEDHPRFFDPNSSFHLNLLIHDEIIANATLPRTKSRTHPIVPIRTLAAYMELAGQALGINTPVEVQYTRTTWKDKKELSLK